MDCVAYDVASVKPRAVVQESTGRTVKIATTCRASRAAAGTKSVDLATTRTLVLMATIVVEFMASIFIYF